eukprot:scaffold3118_cov118-Alexandrium_tamarense.AAC.1
MKDSDDLGDTVTRELYLFVTLHFDHFDHLAFGLTSSAQLLFSSKVALLSARIQEITAPDKAIAERIKDPDAPLEDDALKPHIDRREDAATQVITQLEVLGQNTQTIFGHGWKV